MLDSLRDISFIIWPPLAAWLVLRFLPSSLTHFVQKEIERRSDEKLERIKGEIQGSYSTLKTSIDILTAQNSSVNPDVVNSVKAMWAYMVTMKHGVSGVITFDSVILATEAKEAFSKSNKSDSILDFVRFIDNDAKYASNIMIGYSNDMNEHRIFCGDRLWIIFYVYRALLVRFSMLITQSFTKSDYRDWRLDAPGKQLLEAVLAKNEVENLFKSEVAGLQNIFGRLEGEFIHEATRVMTGSKAIAERLADTQALMQLEVAKVAAK